MSDFTWWAEPGRIGGTDVYVGGGEDADGSDRVGIIVGDAHALLTVRESAELIAYLAETLAAARDEI